MTYYVNAHKNKYDIDFVFSYSEAEFEGYDYTFDTEPKLGQYIVNGNLVADDQYDDIVAPIIGNAVSDTAGVISPIIIHEAPETVFPIAEEAEITEAWKKDQVSPEVLDDWIEKANSLTKLINYASNSANINQDNKLVMNVFLRSGEPRETPLIIDILDPTNNINTTADYIQMLTDQRNEMTTKIIPWIQGELSKK